MRIQVMPMESGLCLSPTMAALVVSLVASVVMKVQNKCLTNEIQVPAATSRKVYLTITFMRSTGITISYHLLEVEQQAFLGCVYLLQHHYHHSLEI